MFRTFPVIRWSRVVTVAALLGGACSKSSRTPAQPVDAAVTVIAPPQGGTETSTDVNVNPPGGEPALLMGAPLIVAPTSHGFGINVALRAGTPAELRAWVHDDLHPEGRDLGVPTSPAADLAWWSVDGLTAGHRYQYDIRRAGETAPLYVGSAITTRPAGTPFTFNIITDSHIQPREPVPPEASTTSDGYMEATLHSVVQQMATGLTPDFLVNMGDTLDFHMFGFNDPPPSSKWTRLGYLNYRRLFDAFLGNVAHFPVVGNWDGENGCRTEEEINRSRSQRMLYVPGPQPTTYPEGGSPTEDYYAFTWGDALFVMLNVMSYTPSCHLLTAEPDDWTLGPAQLAWLEATLAHSTSKWRFTFIHHTVGGNAGDAANTSYGRGGGRAAHVGEQATIHQMLLRYGVQIFFYAHDHVFMDMVVDGVHYTLPGSAGAPWKFTTFETGYPDALPDSGYARVGVSATTAQVDFVGLTGNVLKTFTLQ